MPLVESSSKQAFKSNLKKELAAGRPKKQGLAIAYSVQRRAKKAIMKKVKRDAAY